MTAAATSGCQRKADFTCFWTVENVYSLRQFNDISSPKFIAQFIENTKWSLSVIDDIIQEKKLLLRLNREDDVEPESIEIEFELSVLAFNGLPLDAKKSKSVFKFKTSQLLQLFVDIDEVFLKRRVEFVPNDELTIRCRMWRTESKRSKQDACFIRTRLAMDRYSFIWDIREFSKLQTEGKKRRFINPISKTHPLLSLDLFLSETNGKNYINIAVGKDSATKILPSFGEVSILDCDGKRVHSKERWNFVLVKSKTPLVFRKFVPVNSKKPLVFKDFFEKEKIENDETILQNDVLSLKCFFLIFDNPIYNIIEHYKYLNLEDLGKIPTKNPDHHLRQSNDSLTSCCPFKKAIADLYGKVSLSDVGIRVGASSFQAHKSILSIRSPVFEAMFTQDMKEKASRIVDIPDMKTSTMEHLLVYIYKDIVPDLQWECAMELFRAADKYQLLDLRKKCSFILKSNISATSVCRILSLADMHNDGDLKKAAENYISEHDSEIFNSDEWKSFKEKNFRLVIEIMENMVMTRKK